MSNQKEYTKAKEELIINLEVSKAPVAMLLRPRGDVERGIAGKSVDEILRLFGKDLSYMSAKFVESGNRKIIEEVVLKRKNGSTEKRKPGTKETEALVGIRNTFADEKSIVVPWSNIEPLQEIYRKSESGVKAKVSGREIDLQTGESRPMTDEEIAEFLDYINAKPNLKSFFYDIHKHPHFDSIIEPSLWRELEELEELEGLEELFEEMEKIIRKFSEDI